MAELFAAAALPDDDSQLVKLLRTGHNPNITNFQEGSPLNVAAKVGKEDSVRFLLARGANIESTDLQGRTPLLLAASHGHAAVVSRLIDNNANVEAKSLSGMNAAHFSALYGHHECLKVVIEKCPKLMYETTSIGSRPIHLAATEDYSSCAEVLIAQHEENVSSNPDFATGYEHPLLDQDERGHSALHLAVGQSKVEMIKFLLDYLKKNEIKGEVGELQDHEGYTALHFAVMKCNASVVRKLCQLKTSLRSLPNGMGETPLHLAVRTGSQSLVRFFVDCAVPTDVEDSNGMTAHDIAIGKGFQAITQILESASSSKVKPVMR